MASPRGETVALATDEVKIHKVLSATRRPALRSNSGHLIRLLTMFASTFPARGGRLRGAKKQSKRKSLRLF